MLGKPAIIRRVLLFVSNFTSSALHAHVELKRLEQYATVTSAHGMIRCMHDMCKCAENCALASIQVVSQKARLLYM